MRRLGGRVGFVDVTCRGPGQLVLATGSFTLRLDRKPFAHAPRFPFAPPPPPPIPEPTPEAQRLLAGFSERASEGLGAFFGSRHLAMSLERGLLWSDMLISPDAARHRQNPCR